jgi:hypothetical protein
MSNDNSNRGNVPGADTDAQTAETYNRLFDAFIDGAESGEHRKLRIEDDGERTLLVAYNKWVYAEREKESGIITFYEAWASDAVTNASNLQAGRLRQRIDAMSLFNRMMLVEREPETLIDTEGNEYESFEAVATPA